MKWGGISVRAELGNARTSPTRSTRSAKFSLRDFEAYGEGFACLLRDGNSQPAPQTDRHHDLASQVDEAGNFLVGQRYRSNLPDPENCLSFFDVQSVNMLANEDSEEVSLAQVLVLRCKAGVRPAGCDGHAHDQGWPKVAFRGEEDKFELAAFSVSSGWLSR